MKYQLLAATAANTNALRSWRLTEEGGSVWEEAPKPAWVKVDGVTLIPNGPNGIAISGDGQWMALSVPSTDVLYRLVVCRRNDDEWEMVGNVNVGSAPVAVAISDDGEYIAIAGPSAQRVVRREGTTLTLISLPVANTNGNSFIAISPDGKWVVTHTGTTTWVLQRNEEGTNFVIVTLSPTFTATAGMAFSPDSKFLYVQSGAKTIWVYALTPGACTRVQIYTEALLATNALAKGFQFINGRVYVLTNPGSNTLNVTKILIATADPATGFLTTGNVIDIADTGYLASNMAAAFAVSPDEKWLVLRRQTATNYQAFDFSTIDVSAGVVSLTKVNGPTNLPDNTGGALTAIAFTPELIIGAMDLYNNALLALLSGAVDKNNLKLALLNDGAVFNAAHTQLTQVTAGGFNEVTSTDWPAGGVLMENVHYTAVGNDVALIADPVKASILSAELTFRSAVIYDDASVNKRPIMFVNFGGDYTAALGEQIEIRATGDGLLIFER